MNRESDRFPTDPNYRPDATLAGMFGLEPRRHYAGDPLLEAFARLAWAWQAGSHFNHVHIATRGAP